jgi:hypothetical protein
MTRAVTFVGTLASAIWITSKPNGASGEMDEDTEHAAWAEQELQERHRREDELLERSRRLQAELRQMIREMNHTAWAVYERETNDGDHCGR